MSVTPLPTAKINEAGVSITTIDSPVELACELIEKSFSLETVMDQILKWNCRS